MRDRDGSGGECAVGYPLLQFLKRVGKLGVLLIEGWRGERKRTGFGIQ
jgi:hypothetical protein